jgi:hypothetical protein
MMKSTKSIPLLLVLLSAAAASHEWNSPGAQTPPAAWSARLWAGPASGAPPAPDAEDCRRTPHSFDLPGPQPEPSLGWLPPPGVGERGRVEGGRPSAERSDSDAHPPSDAHRPDEAFEPSAEHRRERAAEFGPREALKLSDADPRRRLAELSRSAASADHAPLPASRPPIDAEAMAQQAARVSAGVVDDNADFAEYLAYRSRHRGLPVRDRDIAERYRLTVHDRDGRVVPDADVRLYAAGREQPLWARTDAGGQVWLHPRAAGLHGNVFEVQVRKTGGDGRLEGRALLRRGQRDQLQITLDGAEALRPVRLDVAFLVDATGSMADEIGKLRDSMQAMAAQIAALPSRPSICWALVAYRDRGDDFFVRVRDFTDDLGAFRQGLAALQADGGNDTPEALNEALHTAVHRLGWRGGDATRLVLLVADAPPHLDYGAPWYDDDMHGALARGIKLMAVGASGLDPSGEYIFRQMAQFTGGRFVFLTYADARRPQSGPGRETVHDVRNYSVQTLDQLVVRLVREELARRPG